MCLFNCRHSTMFFAYQFHNSQKSYQGKDVSCWGSAESHLERNALLLQLHCYRTSFKSISWKQPITLCKVAEADDLITWSWLCLVHWDTSQLNPTCNCRISKLMVVHTFSLGFTLGDNKDILLVVGFNYNVLYTVK